MLSRRTMISTSLAMLAASGGAAQAAAPKKGKMFLCMHSNTTSFGYRAALEGWAKAGIKNVELNAGFVDEFLKTDTLDGARRVLTDNGLTAVHGAVGVQGLLDPSPDRTAAIDNFKRRLDMFAALGVRRVYTTSGTQKLTMDDYKTVAANMRSVGEIAKAADMVCSVEFIRISSYMSTLLTALKVTREAAHPNFGILFDFYHFWSGYNRLEDMDQIRPGEIKHIHFQDVPDMPRELLDMNTRIIPGDGVSPITAMLRKHAEKGYAGPLSVELFLPQFRDGDPYTVGLEIRQKCEAAMKKAGVL